MHKKGHKLKTSPLIKNPQFSSNLADIQAKLPTHEVVILTKFHKDCKKIVDFLLTEILGLCPFLCIILYVQSIDDCRGRFKNCITLSAFDFLKIAYIEAKNRLLISLLMNWNPLIEMPNCVTGLKTLISVGFKIQQHTGYQKNIKVGVPLHFHF